MFGGGQQSQFRRAWSRDGRMSSSRVGLLLAYETCYRHWGQDSNNFFCQISSALYYINNSVEIFIYDKTDPSNVFQRPFLVTLPLKKSAFGTILSCVCVRACGVGCTDRGAHVELRTMSWNPWSRVFSSTFMWILGSRTQILRCS